MNKSTDSGNACDPATLAFYETEASTYVASGRGGTSRWLAPFMDLLPPGARVLELGCGGGRDAAAMLDRGFDVVPTDGSASIAVKASQWLGRHVRVMTFDALTEVEAYDAVWANASLLHVPSAALPGGLARIFRALQPGGLHVASYKAGGVPGRDRVGRYFNYPDLTQLRDAYERSAAWEIEAIVDYVGGGYEGGEGPWLAITARRPGPS